jgi:protein-disulfide isomerase
VQITIDKLFELYPGKLRLSRRENPLAFHRHALDAALLAQEVRVRRGDDAYFDATSKLFMSGLEPEHLDDIAKELGLNVARTRKAIEKQSQLSVIERDQELAAAIKASGTPHFFINGWRINGAQPLSTFREVIDAQLKVAEALQNSGVPLRRLYAEVQKTAKEAELETWGVLPPAADPPSRGRKGAPVVIEFFADLECPHSARAVETLALLEAAFSKQVRVVWRHLPLESIHTHSRLAARAALEARAQKGDGAFWKMVELFYRDLSELDAFSDKRLEDYGKELGLDAPALLAASHDTRHDPAIDADLAAAKAAGMDAAPSTSVAGYRVVGAQPLATFRYLVRQALKKPVRK